MVQERDPILSRRTLVSLATLLLIGPLLGGCDSDDGAPPEGAAMAALESVEGAEEAEAAPREPLELILHGAMRRVNMEQDYSPTVRLADLEEVNHGVGALGGLMGEVTLWGDRLYLAEVYQPDEETGGDNEIRFRSIALADLADLPEDEPELEATLFFGANVARWEILEDHGVTDLAGLEAFLERWSGEEEIQGPVAIRITDPLATVDWHVVDATRFPEEGAVSCEERKEFGHSFTTSRQPARLVGLFTREHTGVVVDHRTNLHTHVITDLGQNGHVDGLELSVGAVIEVGTGG